MIVKRFKAATMQEALALVKQELGDEAVILKSETVARSGILDLRKKPAIEVVAAIDVKPVAPVKPTPNLGGSNGYFSAGKSNLSEPSPKDFATFLDSNFLDKKKNAGIKKRTSKSQKRVVPASGHATGAPESKGRQPVKPGPSVTASPVIKPGEGQEKRISSLVNEVGELRNMIQSMTARIGNIQSEYTMREFADLPAPYADQVMSLMQAGVDSRIARSLVERAASAVSIDNLHDPRVLQAEMSRQIMQKIKVAGPIKCQKNAARVIVLVGPTGSGKTTTLAKLAANSKFVFEKKVALITADTHNVSALEHLNTFAGISKLPISAVYSPEELKAALIAQQDKDLIFIDTAGRSPRNEQHLLELKSFMEYANPTEIHLVLPASMHHIDLLETIRRFSILDFNRVVISKTDESSALGNMLNIAVECEHPVSYITTGQVIPDDIELANAQRMAQMIMRVI